MGLGSEIRDPRSEIRDPRSGIRDQKKPIPDPGSRGQKGTGSRIPDPDPQHWNPRYQVGTKWFPYLVEPTFSDKKRFFRYLTFDIRYKIDSLPRFPYRTRFGFNRVSGYGSGSVFGIRIRLQEGKNYQKSRKEIRNFML
jgi:hypothetical protein